MKLISPIRTLRVLPRAPHLFACTTDGSFLSASPITLSAALFSAVLSHAHALSRWALRHSLGTPSHCSVPQLN
jgi:hypothetical protein